jgi:hypothetical protein
MAKRMSAQTYAHASDVASSKRYNTMKKYSDEERRA